MVPMPDRDAGKQIEFPGTLRDSMGRAKKALRLQYTPGLRQIGRPGEPQLPIVIGHQPTNLRRMVRNLWHNFSNESRTECSLGFFDDLRGGKFP